ncbi:MAG: hypothetical protein P8N02_03470 [Actinomycetota bacterium]|nr:hypothetical protein [Actinomycetota bacterium]
MGGQNRGTGPRRGARGVVGVVLAISLIIGVAGPSSAAQRVSLRASLENVEYSSFSDITLKKGSMATRELRASATVNCGTNQPCAELGLNGVTVTVVQHLGIVVVGDVLTPVVDSRLTGRTTGRIVVGSHASASFTGRVDGIASCTAIRCRLALSVQAMSPGGQRLSLELVRALDLTSVGSWEALSGSGFVSNTFPV